MKPISIIAALAVAWMVASCAAVNGERADECGYTWFRAHEPARFVTVRQEPDWRNYPGRCRDFGIRGCTSTHRTYDGTLMAEILLRFPAEAWHACSTLEHEYRHAAGLDHRETHQYVPTDLSRR